MPCHVNSICLYFFVRRCMVFALLGSNGALWDRDNDTMSYTELYEILALYTHSDFHSNESIRVRRISFLYNAMSFSISGTLSYSICETIAWFSCTIVLQWDDLVFQKFWHGAAFRALTQHTEDVSIKGVY